MLEGWEVCLYVIIPSLNLNEWMSYSYMCQDDMMIIMSFLYIYIDFGIWKLAKTSSFVTFERRFELFSWIC